MNTNTGRITNTTATTTTVTKHDHKVGDRLYTKMKTYYTDAGKTPYTVIAVTDDEITIQEALVIFPIYKYSPEDPHYGKENNGKRICRYGVKPEEIVPNPKGDIRKLRYSNRYYCWVELDWNGNIPAERPSCAYWGEYEFDLGSCDQLRRY